MFIRKNKYNVNKYLEKNINNNVYKKSYIKFHSQYF